MAGGVRALAAATGFSVATISRVLNGSELVSAETRRIVLDAARRLNYTPNPAAKALATRRTRIIGAVIPTIEHSIFARFIHALEESLARSGYALVLATTGNDPRVEAERATDLLNMGAEGLVLSGLDHAPGLLDTVSRRNLPLVCTSIFDPDAGFCTIGYDNRHLGEEAARFLLGLGHRRAAIVHGPIANNDRTRLRLAGARAAFAAGGIPEDRLHGAETELSVPGGVRAAEDIFSAPERPAAILCLSDVLALGVMFEASRRGLSIPVDVSVMGFDNLDWAAMSDPPLTTIRLPVARMGRAVAGVLAECLEQERPLASIRLDGEIIARGSTTGAAKSSVFGSRI